MSDLHGETVNDTESTKPVLYRVVLSRIGLLVMGCLFIAVVVTTSLRKEDRTIIPAETRPGITVDQVDEKLMAVRTELQRNTEKIACLSETVSSDAELIATLRNTLESQRSELDSLRQQMAERDRQKVEEKVTTQASTAVQTTPVKQTRHKSAPRLRPVPFQLVTIDHWNNVPNAVIRANGRLHTLEQGSSWQDWTVDKIDVRAGEVTLRNSLGQTAKITGSDD